MIVKLHKSRRGLAMIFGLSHNECIGRANDLESGEPARVELASQAVVWTDERPEQFRAAVLSMFGIAVHCAERGMVAAIDGGDGAPEVSPARTARMTGLRGGRMRHE